VASAFLNILEINPLNWKFPENFGRQGSSKRAIPLYQYGYRYLCLRTWKGPPFRLDPQCNSPVFAPKNQKIDVLIAFCVNGQILTEAGLRFYAKSWRSSPLIALLLPDPVKELFLLLLSHFKSIVCW